LAFRRSVIALLCNVGHESVALRQAAQAFPPFAPVGRKSRQLLER